MTHEVIEETTYKVMHECAEVMSASVNPKSETICITIQTNVGQQIIYLTKERLEMLQDLINNVIWSEIG
jgi:hypothetical protein